MTAISSQGGRGFELGAAALALFVTAAGWQVLSRSSAHMLLGAEAPSSAIALRPSDSRALTNLAALALARRSDKDESAQDTRVANAKAAEQLVDKALLKAPLDARAMRLLAQSAEMTGDKKRTEALMKIVGQQTIRDGVSNLYLLNMYATQKDYPRALEHADALLRVTPDLGKGALPLLDSIAVDPKGQPRLVELLQSAPPWRGTFLADVASKLTKPEDFIDVILALKDGPHPLTHAELRSYLEPLIARGLVDQAYDTWLQLLPMKRLATLQYVYNGGFEYPVSNVPFDWTITPIEGANAEIATFSENNEHGLHLLFDGKRVSYRNVVQLLKLPAGKYKLSGSYKSNSLENPRGMTWRVYCAQRNDSKPIVSTERITGTSDGWKTFESSFEVPTDLCGAQWLRLELAARVSIEERVSGSIWYDDIKVARDTGKDKPEEPGDSAPAIRMPEQPGDQFERAIRGR